MENNEQSVWVTDVYGQWVKVKGGCQDSSDPGHTELEHTVPTIDKQVEIE